MAVMVKTDMEVKGMLINKEYKNQDLNKDLGRMMENSKWILGIQRKWS